MFDGLFEYEDYYLVEYIVDENGELEEIKNLKHDDSGEMITTEYDCFQTFDLETKITYPYGGISQYTYYETYCAEGDNDQKPMVSAHLQKADSEASNAETQRTTFTYYNEDDENLATTEPEGDVKVDMTRTILKTLDFSEPLYQQKNETYYAYNNDDYLKGESKHIAYIWENNDWDFKKAECHDFKCIIPEYYEIDLKSHFYTSDQFTYGDYVYRYTYVFDWYGQVKKEKKVDENEDVIKEVYYDYVYSYRRDSPVGDGLNELVPFEVTVDDWNDVDDNETVALYPFGRPAITSNFRFSAGKSTI